MAVDSRNKRFSLLSVGQWKGRVLPNPDGGFGTAADREQLAVSYAFSGTPVPSFSPAWATSSNQVVGPVVEAA
jgi:hypothetical protein